MLSEDEIEEFVAKYVKDGQVLGIGSSEQGETFLKKIALKAEEENLSVRVVPTSAKMVLTAKQMHLPVTSLDEEEIDFAVEFVEMADHGFNFIKRKTHSLVRDKMIAQSAEVLMVVLAEKCFVKKLMGVVPFEIAVFGHKRTLVQLENLGSPTLRRESGKAVKTESGNYLVDVLVDEIHSVDDLEFEAKNIPGVLETGLFIGYADKLVLHNDHIEVKSRLKAEHAIKQFSLSREMPRRKD